MDEWLKELYAIARSRGVRFIISRDNFTEWVAAYWDGVSPEDHVAKWGKEAAR